MSDEDDNVNAEFTEDQALMVEPDGVGVNLDDRKINELAIDVWRDEDKKEEEGEYRQAA